MPPTSHSRFAKLASEPNRVAWRRARQTAFRNATASRLRPPSASSDDPLWPTSDGDPVADLLPLQMLRETLAAEWHERNREASDDARSQALKRMVNATSASAFFYGWPDLTLWRPLNIVAAGGPAPSDLTALIRSFESRGERVGLWVTGDAATGKTVSLWKVWHDCFHAVEGEPLLSGHIPYWLPSDRLPTSWGSIPDGQLIPALLARDAGLWKPTEEWNESQQRIVAGWLKYSPPLLILCDLNHAPHDQQPRLTRALTAFQESFGHRHRCVAMVAKSGEAPPPGSGFRHYQIEPMSAEHAESYLLAFAEYERWVRSIVGLPARDVDELPLRQRTLSELLDRKSRGLFEPTRTLGTPLVAHAVACLPVGDLEGLSHDLLLLFRLVKRHQACRPRLPRVLERWWNEFQRGAIREHLLQSLADDVCRRWRAPPEAEEVAIGDRDRDSDEPDRPYPFVEPHYGWLPPAANEAQRGSLASSILKSEPFLDEDERRAVTHADQEQVGNQELDRLCTTNGQDGLRLALAEDANAGKTVFTYRLRFYSCDRAAGRATLFQGLPPLVIRCEHRAKKIPWPSGSSADEAEENLRRLLCQVLVSADKSLAISEDDMRPEVELLLQAGRVLLILDAVDQAGDVRRLTDSLLQPQRSALKRCHVVVTGRSFAFDPDRQEQDHFPRHAWRYFTLLAFDENQKARFLADVLPDEPIPDDANDDDANEDDTIILDDDDDDDFRRRFDQVFEAYGEIQELLGIPGLLAMVRRLILDQRRRWESQPRGQENAPRKLQGMRTRADLHWLYYVKEIEQKCARRLGLSADEHGPWWRAMLAVTAFRMVLERCDGFSVRDEGMRDAVQRDVQHYCDRLGLCPITHFHERTQQTLREKWWRERWKELNSFSVLADHGILEGLASQKTFSWRHKSWMEFFCGLFFANYADSTCWRAFQFPAIAQSVAKLIHEQQIDEQAPGFQRVDDTLGDAELFRETLRQVTNDPSWEWAWRCAMDMPRVMDMPGETSHVPVEAASWRASLDVLFQRPTRGRRPTELMYRAWTTFQKRSPWRRYEPSAADPLDLRSDLQRAADQIIADYQRSFFELLQHDGPWPDDLFGPEGISPSGRSTGEVAAQLVPCFRAEQWIQEGRLARRRWNEIGRPLDLSAGTSPPWWDPRHWLSFLWRRPNVSQRSPEFVLCLPDGQPATFWQGSAEGVGDGDERPRHQVRVSPFWMQATAVTVEQYCGLFDPGLYREHGSDIKQRSLTADSPVVMVDWYDTFCFALWIGAQLPSETQWEFACRAGHDGERDLFGIPYLDPETNQPRYDALSSREANFDGNYPYGGAPEGDYLERTVSVRDSRFAPNDWGLWQMHGNVWEWTRDLHEPYAERWTRVLRALGKRPHNLARDVEAGELEILLGQLSEQEWSRVAELQCVPTAGLVRVLRGGSWYYFADSCRAAYRNGNLPDVRSVYYGFRVVCVG